MWNVLTNLKQNYVGKIGQDGHKYDEIKVRRRDNQKVMKF